MYSRVRLVHEGLVKGRKTGTPYFPNGLDTGRVFALSQQWFHWNELLNQMKIECYPYLDELKMYTHIKLMGKFDQSIGT